MKRLDGRAVILCGGRHFNDRAAVHAILSVLDRTLTVCHGSASGADTLVDEEARRLGFDVARYPADWDRHGRAAGPIRNRRMLAEEPVVAVLAFPGGSGTADMVRVAKAKGVPVVRIGWPNV